MDEQKAIRGDTRQGYLAGLGCTHATSATTTATIASCQAYTMNETPTPQLQYVEETTARSIVYSAGNGTYWVVVRSNIGVVPGGFTCSPTGSAYCWILSATQPVLPAATLFVMKVTVASGAISAVEDIGRRRFTVSQTLTASLTLGRQAHWHFEPDAPLSINAGVVLTVGGCIEAGAYRIFSGADVLIGVDYTATAPCSTVRPEWWGAIGDAGVTTGQQVFFRAASDALALGGTLLGAGPTAHYKFNDIWFIHASNFTFDGQDALFSGDITGGSGTFPTIRVEDNCGQECSGETSQFRRNVHLRNYRVGTTGLFPTDQMRGAVLHGCENCSVSNVRVKSGRGTTFTLFRCNNCLLEDIFIENGSEIASSFATLLVHSNNTTVRNWYARGMTPTTGACCFIFQVKGGVGNRVENATIEDMNNPAVAIGDHAFFSRGDAPWKDSETNPVNDPYPFLTNPQAPPGQQDCKLFNCYLFPDPRRASVDTHWSNIAVRRTKGMNCMTIQEAQGDTVQGFYAEDCRIGWQVNQTIATASGERNFILDNFQIKRIALEVLNGDGFVGVNINGAGLGSVDGRTVAVAGFRNIRISNGLIQTTAGQGVLLSETSDVTMTNVTVLNASQKGTTDRHGITVRGASRDIKLIGNRVDDNQAVPTITQGFRVEETVVQPTIIGNSVVCTNCVFGTFHYYRALPVGRYTNNTPAFCTARTIDATPDSQRCVILTKDGDRFKITSTCAARQGTTNRAVYERTALVEDNVGVITIFPNTGTGDITFESDTDWELDYIALLEELRIRPKGDTGQTVDWFCDIDLINLIP